MAIRAKAIVLQKSDIGELRIRADFDADFPEPIPHTQTLSRQVEEIVEPSVITALTDQWDTIFALLNVGIPPE